MTQERLTLREWRRRKGLTQKELAVELGVATNTVTRIESGETEPRPSTLRKIYAYFGIDGSQFVWQPSSRRHVGGDRAATDDQDVQRRAA